MKKTLLRKFLAAMARPLASALHKSGLMRPEFFLKLDGGISSQMHFYLVGEYLRQNGDYPLRYDLTWYEECAKDLDGCHNRNFDLLRLCPDLQFPKVSSRNLKVRLYRLLYTHEHNWDLPSASWKELRPPLYLTGYYAPDKSLYDRIPTVFRSEPEGLDDTDKAAAEQIKGSPDAIGMHVRRGDLARYLPAYGRPAPALYFRNALELLYNKYGVRPDVFIFSDDPDWVEKDLLPGLPEGRYHSMRANDSSRGYVDLWLLSKCRHFIASAGSFGKFAAMMNPGRGDVVIYSTPEAAIWRQRIAGVILADG